jgi:hypothetical protein
MSLLKCLVFYTLSLKNATKRHYLFYYQAPLSTVQFRIILVLYVE